MPNVNMAEIVLLLVLGVIIFGPDKLPSAARSLARVLTYLRGIARDAQSSVKRELGPEYADLTMADLQPKAILRRMMAEDYDTIESEIRAVGTSVRELDAETRAELQDVRALATGSAAAGAAAAASTGARTTAVVADGGSVVEGQRGTVLVAPDHHAVRWDADAT